MPYDMEDDFAPRIKKRKLNSVEAQILKITEDKSDEEDIHPLQRHHTLDAESISKLAAIRINLIHEVPPQHNVEKLAGTRVPSKEEKKEIAKYISIKKGPYDAQEDEIIVDNWLKFCELYNWNKKIVQPFLNQKRKGFFYMSSSNERRKFVQFLANGLPNRTLYSVFYRFRNLFSRHKQERYSAEEDAELLKAINGNLRRGEKPDYAKLAKKFNRTRASVWRRYTLISEKNIRDNRSDSDSD